nr:cytochrome c [Burkholderiales bacterium]
MLRKLASAVALIALASCTTPTEQAAMQEGAAQVAAKPAGPHPGEDVYKQHCAACHDNAEATKAPTRATLARMTSGMITNALMTGKMIPQATGLSSQQVSYVSDYLSEATVADDSWIEAMRCPTSRRTPKLDTTPTVQAFGFD